MQGLLRLLMACGPADFACVDTLVAAEDNFSLSSIMGIMKTHWGHFEPFLFLPSRSTTWEQFIVVEPWLLHGVVLAKLGCTLCIMDGQIRMHSIRTRKPLGKKRAPI